MSIESELLECMLRLGLSEHDPMTRRILNIAPAIGKCIERERRSRAIRDMLPTLGAEAAAQRCGVCRATVYNAAKKSKKFAHS